MQNRDRNQSDEDRSRGDRSHEEMRGNMGRSSTPSRSSNPDRSSQDRESVLPRTESDSDSEFSGRSRHITGEGEPVDESDIPGSRGFESDSERERSGNGRTGRS